MVERLLTYLIRLMAPFVGDMAISYRPFRGSGNRPAASGRGQRRRALNVLLGFGVLLLFNTGAAHAEAPVHGTTITNQASLTYSGGSSSAEVACLVSIRTPATVDFLQYAPANPAAAPTSVALTEYRSGADAAAPFASINPPQLLDGTTIDLSQPLALLEATIYHEGEPLFLRLSDLDQNLDPGLAETILLNLSAAQTGDIEILRLSETGPDTGVFTGYLQSSLASAELYDGVLSVAKDQDIRAFYTDIFDNADTTLSEALIDPFGIIFDSRNGQPVSGATVTLYDEAGNLATVYGDDGISSYPSSVVSGGQVVDSSGQVYNFIDGGFRFPFMATGNYRLEVTPPAGYSAPSTASSSDLQILPGAPFALSDSSFGALFALNPGPALRIDIPVDPAAGALWLRKQASQTASAIGEFIQYTLTVDNSDNAAATGELHIEDRLPAGFRYQKGSLHIDGSKVADPSLSGNGQTMTIVVGSTPAGQNQSISYVVEVSSGAKLGEAINYAVATGANGNQSNTAQARVLVRDDFLRNSTFLLGKVMAGGCSQADTGAKGLANVRIYLEDGSYADTDEHGNYHFEGLEPGVHVVQVDTMSLPHNYEMLPCEQTSQFAGRSFSQFIDLQGGTLWRADFYAAPIEVPAGEVSLTLSAELDANTAEFMATAATSNIPADNLRLAVMLPGGFSYLPGSARRDVQTIEDPQVSAGSLMFHIDSLASDQSARISFSAHLDGAPASDELPTKAVLSFDTPTGRNRHTPPAETRFQLTPGEAVQSSEIKLYPNFPSFVAELQQTDKVMLEQLATRLQGQKIVRLDVVGHTDSQRVMPRSRHIFSDNQALSRARARSVADLLKEHLSLPEDGISIRGMGETMPVADNATTEGRALNRRVEVYLVAEAEAGPARLAATLSSSPKQTISIGSQEKTPSDAATEIAPVTPQAVQTGLLSPVAGQAVNRIDAVRLRLDSKLKPRLTLDGVEIPTDRIGFRMTEPETNTTIYSYIGVDFGAPGTHKLAIEGLGPFGNARFNQNVDVIRTGEIGSILLLGSDGNIADGRSPVRLQLEIRDTQGALIRSQVQLSIRGGDLKPTKYQANELDSFNQATELSQQMVTVDRDGFAEFHPVNASGLYRTVIGYNDTEVEFETYVKPQMRDWILVGFAEGTLGYNDLSGSQVSLDEAGIDEHFYDDGQVKFFAKGAIKGEWLLTMAYDSDKPDRDGDSLHQIIDPDSYYPLYGDGTQQGYEASSARSLYLKIERDQFYALFGDMNTGLTQTELSRYSRSMNGIKSEMQTDTFSYTLFAADTKQAFAKDEIRGDGTSGRYYLSQTDLVINSETVTIETRDRFHSQKIIETKTLARHSDYDIDYDDGSLFFKRPIPSKDENFNPTFIVVDYETLDASDENFNYGGRAAAKLLDGKVEVGASYVHEEKGAGEGDLYGADVTVELTPQTSLHAEAATTETNHYDVENSGEAYLAEVIHKTNKLKGNIYYREQQQGFGLGQQKGSETGTRKYGAEGSYNVTPQLSLAGLAYHEDNLGTDAKRDVAELESRFAKDNYGVRTGLRGARDQFANGEKQRSNQWLIGGNWTTPDRKLNLRGDYEQSLGGNNENSDYPTLLTLGADYQLTKKVSVFTEQEFSWGASESTDGTRAGLKSMPWQGADLRTTVEQQTNENGQRVFALFGLGQNWQVNKLWSVDASLDRSHTIKEPGNASFNTNVPPAHGSNDDFTAVSIGATRTVEKWTWWNRLETRQADSEDKYGISSSVVGEPQKGIAVSAKALAFIAKSSGGTRRSDGNLRLGMAYRPAASRWIVLNRLDFYFDNEESNSADYDSYRIVNNLHANFRLSSRMQMSFYYGLKYVRDNFDSSSYSGFTDLIAFETRYNINKRWDVGVHGSVLHSWNSGTLDYSAGADIGYSPMTNTWVSLGYNLVGFEDEDFSAATYTAQGAYMRFRAKFDQQSVRDAASWLNR